MEKLRARDYRRMAKENCKGQGGKLALLTLLEGVLMDADLIIGGPVSLGDAEIQKALYEKKEWSIGTLFSKFNRFGVSFVVNLLANIFLCLWSMLFCIPGIIKMYSYSMIFFLMQDDETLTGKAAITASRKLMKGHKWELFCLELSYIGWIILSMFTFGILLFWVVPKMNQAFYCFYRHISGQDTVAE